MKRIGILGGSFNPAHEGHVRLSQTALKIFDFDEVWWVVAPKNPFKSNDYLKEVDERISFANIIKNSEKIKVRVLEKLNGDSFTIDLVKSLVSFDNNKYYWLMGEDNLKEFHKWRDWQEISNLINIIVFPRNCESDYKDSVFYKTLKNVLVDNSIDILNSPSPSWTICPMKEIDISSTELNLQAK
jgi:nicotinate-nucleotide adenylyltransferase